MKSLYHKTLIIIIMKCTTDVVFWDKKPTLKILYFNQLCLQNLLLDLEIHAFVERRGLYIEVENSGYINCSNIITVYWHAQ